MNPYKTLGVTEDDDEQIIKKAYRKLAATHHPDRGGDAEKFKVIAEAYAVLSNKDKLREWKMQNNPHLHAGAGFSDIFGQGFNPFEDLFRAHTQSRQRQTNKDTQDGEIQFNLRINLEQIKKGSIQAVTFKRNKLCIKCSGSGGRGKRVCGPCGGTGTQTIKPLPFLVQHISCQSCYGAGITFDDPCRPCATQGYVQVEDKVVVKIEEE